MKKVRVSAMSSISKKILERNQWPFKESFQPRITTSKFWKHKYNLQKCSNASKTIRREPLHKTEISRQNTSSRKLPELPSRKFLQCETLIDEIIIFSRMAFGKQVSSDHFRSADQSPWLPSGSEQHAFVPFLWLQHYQKE